MPRPHDALVPVKAKALASGIAKAVVGTGHHNAALTGLKRVPRQEGILALDHADDVRARHEKAHQLATIGREDRHVNLAQLAELLGGSVRVLLVLAGLLGQKDPYALVSVDLGHGLGLGTSLGSLGVDDLDADGLGGSLGGGSGLGGSGHLVGQRR